MNIFFPFTQKVESGRIPPGNLSCYGPVTLQNLIYTQRFTLCIATRRSMSSSVWVGHGSVEAVLLTATGLADPLEPCRSLMIGELPAISDAFDSSENKEKDFF